MVSFDQNSLNGHIPMNTIKGLVGLSLSISAPWLDFFGSSVQVIGALLGLLLLFISIRHKHLQYQNEKLVNKNLKDEKN